MSQIRLTPRVRALAVVNGVLLLVLTGLSMGSVAVAQAADNRAPGSYMVVGGDIQSGNTNAIYIIDTNNQEMIAMRWVQGRNRLEGIGYQDLKQAVEAGGDR